LAEERKEKPICPLSYVASDYVERCVEDGCAWWDARNGMCAVLTLARAEDDWAKGLIEEE
jgi:hypothetical protein